MGRLNFGEKQRKGGGGVQGESFLCLSGEKGILLYSSQHELGPGCGLVSSAQQGPFLSRLPRGGAPASAPNTGREVSLEGGATVRRVMGWKDTQRFQETDMC